MENVNKAYRTLVHAINYLRKSDPTAAGLLETARREVFRVKGEATKYALYRHHCDRCYRYFQYQRQ